MKKSFLLVLAIICLSSTIDAQARYRAAISGQIVDAQNNPIPGAKIRISNNWMVEEIMSDHEGQYFSHLLDEGGYWVAILADGKCIKSRRIIISPTDRVKRYYNFRVYENAASVHHEDRDPYFRPYSQKVKDQPVKWNYLTEPNGPSFWVNNGQKAITGMGIDSVKSEKK